MSKIAVAGNASGTGTFTIAAPNSNTDRTLNLPDSAGTLLHDASSLAAANLTGTIAAARLPAGSVLQVATSNSNAYARVQTTSTSYVATGYGVSITPSSTSNRILLLFSVGMTYGQTANNGVILAIARNTTVINSGDSNYGGSFFQIQQNTIYNSVHMSWVDSPSTTSSVTYNLYGRSQNGNTVFLAHEGSSYSLTALEIAA